MGQIGPVYSRSGLGWHVSPGATIPRFRMDFREGDPQAFDAYSATMSDLFDIEWTGEQPKDVFRSRFNVAILDEISLARHDCSVPIALRRTVAAMARGGVDQLMLYVNLQGERTLTIDGHHHCLASGEILVLDMAQMAIVESEPFVSLLLTAPRSLFHGQSVDVHGLIIRRGAVQRALVHFLNQLATDAPSILKSEAPRISRMVMAFVSASLAECTNGRNRVFVGPASLSTIKPWIEDRLADPNLRSSLLMATFHLSRPTLYRLFEPYGGVKAYITERRLQRAFRLLTNPANASSASKIATEVGFASPSAFTHAFREKFDITPSEARKLTQRSGSMGGSAWVVPEVAQPYLAAPNTDSDLAARFIDEA